MVKKFSYLCDFSGKKHPVTFYIGDAAKDHHPIGFQNEWLRAEKGGIVPKNLMDSLEKIKEIADTQKVPFEDLCEYVIEEIKLSKVSNAKISSNLGRKSIPKKPIPKKPTSNKSVNNNSAKTPDV